MGRGRRSEVRGRPAITALAILLFGLTSVNAQSIGFVAAKDAPIFCKFEPGKRLESARTPPPMTGFELPVYVRAPERDLFILGELMMNGAGVVHDTKEVRPWAIGQLAAAAKERGADAIWLVEPFAGRYCQVIVIKWRK
jgi:hypothetical protein